MRHPAVTSLPEITPGRRRLAAFALLMLVLTFSFAPIGPQSVLESAKGLLNWIRHPG
jgi:hypothetical protein